MSLCKECLFLLYNSMVSFFFLGHSFVYPYLFTLHLIFFLLLRLFFAKDCLDIYKILMSS